MSYFKSIICWIITFQVFIPGEGQNKILNEHFAFCTDRSIYIAGETIQFSVFDLSDRDTSNNFFSAAYYTQLISYDREIFASTAIKMNMGKGGHGTINIPTTLPSGNYFIAGYTKWLMNRGPEGYNYLSVTILNPYLNKKLNERSHGTLSTIISQRTPTEYLPDVIIVQGNNFPKRAWVSFTIDPKLVKILDNACLTVVPSGATGYHYHNEHKDSILHDGALRYLPETSGMTLSGLVVGKDSAPVPFAKVYFTSLGPDRHFYCAITDATGSFQFSLPDQSGKVEFFGSAEYHENMPLNLMIDQNFTNEFTSFPSLDLSNDSASMALYNQLAVNAQIADQFGSAIQEFKERDSVGHANDNPRIFFYGRPSKSIRIDDYIKLPSLEEYFNDVIPEVSVRRRNNRKQFIIHGNNTELNIFDPLVMIDGVAIFDMDAVLKISPRHLVQIDIVTAPYIRGNVIFGGIINIISKEDNFGYVELPSSGLLFEYNMFTPGMQSKIDRTVTSKHIPDVRNTLYWVGKVDLSDRSGHRFRTNDVSGDYEIKLMGFTEEGKYIESTSTFFVE